ncbi:MAG: hypothetical protein JW861_09295 [Bacteroidales bacterium]|nr:hypothetical protein [Bacteroidales bacterium]
MKIDFYPNEMVIKAGKSEQMINGSRVNGKLILTNQRLYFVPVSDNEHHYRLEIMPDEIREVMLFNNRLLFPSGLNIITREGKELRFLVKDRSDWNAMIARMC